MKSKTLKYLWSTLLVIAFGVSTVPAAGLAYEGFDYPPSPLNTQSGGSGFVPGPWAADVNVTVQPPGLSTLLGLPSMGLCAGGGFFGFRQLANPLNQSEYWVSYMIQAAPGNDMVYLGLDTVPSTSPSISFGRLLNTCFIRQGNTTLGQVAYPWSVGSTDLLVAHIKQLGLFTQVELWVNPPNFTIPPLLTVAASCPAYTWVNLQVQPGFLADEIRIGTTPGDVAGVTLGGSVTGGNLTLTWSHGTLLEAPTPTGPWHTNSAAASPYTVPMSSPQQFYRVVVQ